MKYKLLLISIFITIIRTETQFPKERSDSKQQTRNDLNFERSKQARQPVKFKIKVDKVGNRWAFDENTKEWTHLPPQQINSLPNLNTGYSNEEQGDNLPDQSSPGILSPIQFQKEPQTSGNNPSIYGPHFPDEFKPFRNPAENFEQGNFEHTIADNSPIYGPLPFPGEFDSEEEDNNNDLDSSLMTWQNNFPIPGGPNYPNSWEKPNIDGPDNQSPIRKEKPILEEFDDPFESKTKSTNKPSKVKKMTQIAITSTTADQYEYNDNFQTLPPVFRPVIDDEDDDELGPYVPDVPDEPDKDEEEDNHKDNQQDNEQGNQQGYQSRPNSSKKPKPIIKLPIGPPEQPGLWTIFNQRPIPSTESSLQNNDVIELFPPIPPELPGNVDNTSKPNNETTDRPVNEQAVEMENKPKEITFPPTEKEIQSISSTSISRKMEMTTLSHSTHFSTEITTPSQALNDQGESVVAAKDPWQAITLGRRHHTPVPIIRYPSLAPSASDLWKPVMGQFLPGMGQFSHAKSSPVPVHSAFLPSVPPLQEPNSNWVRPAMGSVMGSMNANIMNIIAITTRKETSMTTTHPTSTTVMAVPMTSKRKLIKKRIIKTTTESKTTTTEIPKTVPKRIVTKRVKRLKSTTTERPTTILSTTLPITAGRRMVKRTGKPKLMVTSTSSTTTPTKIITETPFQEFGANFEVNFDKEAIDENKESETIDEEPDENDDEADQLETTSSVVSESKDQDSIPESIQDVDKEETSSETDTEEQEDQNQEPKPTSDEIYESSKEDNDQENDGIVEEDTEEVSAENSTEFNKDPNSESDDSKEYEIYEEEITNTSEGPIGGNVDSNEVVEEEEEEEETPIEGSIPAKVTEEVKENDGPKQDNNEDEEVIEYEYEYEDVTEEPNPEPNESEEVFEDVSDENSDVEETTKGVSNESNDDKWQLIFPMKRKGSPNLFP